MGVVYQKLVGARNIAGTIFELVQYAYEKNLDEMRRPLDISTALMTGLEIAQRQNEDYDQTLIDSNTRLTRLEQIFRRDLQKRISPVYINRANRLLLQRTVRLAHPKEKRFGLRDGQQGPLYSLRDTLGYLLDHEDGTDFSETTGRWFR